MRTSAFLVIGLVALLSAHTASAENFSGVLCNPDGPSTAAARYGQFGVHNLSTTARLLVSCGGVTEGRIATITVTVYDRSSTQDFAGTVFVTDTTGNALFSAGLVTSGNAPGPMTRVFRVPLLTGVVVIDAVLPNAATGFSHLTSYTIVDNQ
jgi:hypothetical protein